MVTVIAFPGHAGRRRPLTRWRSLARHRWWPTPCVTTVDPVPTALLSVYDKSGIAELATALHDEGWTILSSGGTAAAVAAAGVPVTDVAELTGFPAILGHRVVTLHPKVHGGILADPTDPAHQADLAAFGIGPIALVVVNLYPFGNDPGIELIDVGGPAMVRAAAKNHAHVAVVVDPADYDAVVAEIVASGGVDAVDAPAPGPTGVRHDRRLRPRHRRMARRHVGPCRRRRRPP